MTRYIWTGIDYVPRAEYRRPPQPARSSFPAPMLIRDFAEPVKSMISGEHFGSRGALQRHYDLNGVKVVGNDLNDRAVYPVDTHDPATGQSYEPWDGRQVAKEVPDDFEWTDPL